MYAVVYDNKVIVGPMKWNRALYQGSLEKKGIKKTLPGTAPTLMPYVVTESAKIMQALEQRPALNALVEYHLGPLWEITETHAIAHYEVMDTQIDSARYNLKQQAADERYKKEVAGTKVNIQDTTVSIDTARGARDIFIQKYLLMADDAVVNWKFPESWLLLTKEDLGAVVAAGAAYVQSCFDWEESISSQIDSAQNKEQLTAINIVETEQQPTPE